MGRAEVHSFAAGESTAQEGKERPGERGEHGTTLSFSSVVMKQGPLLPPSPSQPNPASSLEVPVVVLPEGLQDDGDDRHEGFHDAELQRGLHGERHSAAWAAGTSHCPPCSSCYPQPRHTTQPLCSQDRDTQEGAVLHHSSAVE